MFAAASRSAADSSNGRSRSLRIRFSHWKTVASAAGCSWSNSAVEVLGGRKLGRVVERLQELGERVGCAEAIGQLGEPLRDARASDPCARVSDACDSRSTNADAAEMPADQQVDHQRVEVLDHLGPHRRVGLRLEDVEQRGDDVRAQILLVLARDLALQVLDLRSSRK